MIDYKEYEISYIEREILSIYKKSHIYDLRKYKCLLEVRKQLLDKQALAHQEELLSDIVAFNDAQRNALQIMYERAEVMYNQVARLQPNIKLEVQCLFGAYPKLHPYQAEDREDMWEALCDDELNPIYGIDGTTLHTLFFPYPVSFEAYIGMDCPPPNWNEGLDPELTKDLHLTSAFHHLFAHTNFALTDFIYIRDFEQDINMNIYEPIMSKSV